MRIFSAISSILFFAFTSQAQISYSPQSGSLSINASGSDGSEGSDGGYLFYSRHGKNGSDGTHGGDISLSLSYADATKSKVTVHIQIPSRNVNDTKIYNLSELSNITLTTNGGDGGNGGDGRRGDDGSDGYDGSSGCPPSGGSDGSRGEDGGDAGDGGDGGNGGRVRVYVPEGQSELLMLIKSIQNSAGSAGSSGNYGRGGDGGDGGDGGSNTCENGGSSGWDGSDGWDGSNGRSGSSGSSGNNGSHGFVLSGQGETTYPEMYNLVINGLEYTDENSDGIIEYGEKISITKLTITNTSSMPSPQNIEIVGLDGIAPYLKWLNSQNSAPIKSLKQNESIQLSFPVGHFQLQATDMARFEDVSTKMPLGYAKATFINSFPSLPSANIRRIGLLSNAKPNEKLFWGQSRALQLTLINQASVAIGKQSHRPLFLSVKLKSPTLTAKDVKLVYGQKSFEFNDKNEAIVELESFKPGANALDLTATVGNRTDLHAQLNFEFALIKSEGNLHHTLDKQITQLSLAKDLLKESYVFKIPVKEKIYCFYGKNNKKRRVKEVSIMKVANNATVEFGMTLSKFFFFKSVSPKFYQGRHDLSLYLEDLQSKQLTGQKLVGFLNSYAKPGTQTTFSPNKPDWVINSCELKTKK
jgi:hypothetical protein